MCRGGGEQVALCFHKAFPAAPIYTLCYGSELTFPEFKECDIRPSWLQNFVKTDEMMKKVFFPFGILAMKSLNLSDYDVVLMSGTHCAKYVKTHKRALVISYSFTPFRLAWDPASYPQYVLSTGWKRMLFDQVISILRTIDKNAAQRPNHFVAMTDETADRLRNAYDRNDVIRIINPPVKVNNFNVSPGDKNSYFLVVSRLEYYKKVDLVIDAFNELGYRLVVVGKGTQESEIKNRAKSNIEFMSGLSAEKLAEVYANCRAFIFPQHEDYGITPLEANACGKPVIAYGAGGVVTTQIPVGDESSVANSTAIFFEEQDINHLINAVKKFERLEPFFDPLFIRKNAEKFDEAIFISKIQKYVKEMYRNTFVEEEVLTR
ncbi:glycosyltransferase [Rudanella paleaurantiibacter]|uniref:Glycosyltransferase n=2 Tax=Rudanella paleaurantiibacter TaxID=2614655 RepID=A0A7J5TXY2_9BACT|nr:glycosyltransferase [Rudanella paleaurantiibacter]